MKTFLLKATSIFCSLFITLTLSVTCNFTKSFDKESETSGGIWRNSKEKQLTQMKDLYRKQKKNGIDV